jgi:hypothetical protein
MTYSTRFRWCQFPKALAGALVALVIWQAPAVADPALWVVKDADSTIYLFGTIHVMRPETQWRTAAINAAFATSSELWVEATGDDDQQAMGRLVARYGMDPAHPLFDKLPLASQHKLLLAAQKAHLDPAAVNKLRPWLAALKLSLVPLFEAGFDPDKGVDHALEAAAKAAGKPIRALETPEQQIRLFAGLPPADELDLLKQTLQEIDQGPQSIGKMIDVWMAGDVDGIDAEITRDLRQQAPSLYQSVIVSRNAAWTKKIEALLAGQGTIFMAVGAGHLAGADSVITMLLRDGYQVTQR